MNTTTVVIIALACVTIGYLGGVLMSALTRPKRTPEEEELRGISQAGVVDPERAAHLLAALYRDAPGAPLQVEIAGKTLRSADELKYDQRERLEKLVLELKGWLGYGPVPEAPITPPVAVSAVEPVPAPAPVSAPAGPPVAAPRPEKGGEAPAKSAPLSIVEQVDEILQSHLAGTPLATRGIRLSEVPQQGVVVWVGLDHYDGIDNVPDPEVKALIRDAVKEWEKRYR